MNLLNIYKLGIQMDK